VARNDCSKLKKEDCFGGDCPEVALAMTAKNLKMNLSCCLPSQKVSNVVDFYKVLTKAKKTIIVIERLLPQEVRYVS